MVTQLIMISVFENLCLNILHLFLPAYYYAEPEPGLLMANISTGSFTFFNRYFPSETV